MKRFACCFLTAIFLLSMAGCSGEVDIAGIWEQEMEISVLGVEGTGSAVSIARFTFREDGTGTQEQIISNKSYPDAVREFSYQLEGESLTIVYDEDQIEVFTISLKKDSLQLENRRGNFDLTRVHG